MSTRNIIFVVIAFVFVILIMWAGTNKNNSRTDLYGAVSNASSTEELTESTVEASAEINTNKKMTTATITTNQGVITLELYKEQSPKAVDNFVKLANEGFYNGTRFHRVIKDFMIQGGDPNSKDLSKVNMWGTGGPGYAFDDDIDPTSPLYKTGYQKGVLAMANSGPNTNGSQFFIMHKDYPLPPSYVIFGKVTSGLDVVDTIATTPTGPGDRPLSDMLIEKIEIK